MKSGIRTAHPAPHNLIHALRPSRRHNPVALRQVVSIFVDYDAENDKFVEMQTSEIQELHPTKGWRRQRGTYKRGVRDDRIHFHEGASRVGQPPIVGYRYHVLPNPKHRKVA